MYDNAWWVLFYISLAGNVLAWAVVLLRILQNLDRYFAQICLLAHILPPLGFTLTFIYGWVRVREFETKRVMFVWTASVAVFLLIGIFE